MIDINIKKKFPIIYSVFNKIRRDIYLARLNNVSGRDNSREIFDYYFKHNLFGDADSLSGTGSSLEATQTIRNELPNIFQRLNIKSLLDIPCGDFYWAKEIDWIDIEYTGADVVAGIIDQNNQSYKTSHRRFIELDILEDALPQNDLILCRDLFIHFSNEQILNAIDNIKKSGARYLLTTHYTKVSNKNIKLGSFRPINLKIAPFFFPPPEQEIADDDYVRLWGRTLSLWKIEDLPQYDQTTHKEPQGRL